MNEVQVVSSSWLSPIVLFCILNLTIAIIYILNPQRNIRQKHERNPQLIRVPSIFERIKSFNLSKYQPDPVHQTMSDAETRAVREKMTAFNGGEDEAVDSKADDFINRFRQQLELQRLNSILRYKEMLKRGMGRS